MLHTDGTLASGKGAALELLGRGELPQGIVCGSNLLAYAFSVGYASCWLSLPVGWALGIAITYPRYFGKKWMSKRVVRDPVRVVEAGEEEEELLL